MASRFDVARFVEKHGVVLASAKGPVPNVAEAIAGGPIRGSWWSHAKGHAIFRALNELDDASDVLCFRLVDDKITFVHRRLWPALARMAKVLGPKRITAIRQEHTDSGAHRNVLTPFPKWATRGVLETAKRLNESEARAALGPWIDRLR